MRAFLVTWRAIASFYNELFFQVSISVLWWITGGIFVGAVVLLSWPLVQVGGPWWLAPLVAIPAGPASAALAHVARRSARAQRVDRSFFWEGLRTYWRLALVVNAINMSVLALLLLNLEFYWALSGTLFQALAILWLYLIIFWLGVQFYLFPVLVGMEKPAVLGILRTAPLLVFASPLFSVLLVLLGLTLTGFSVALPIVLVLAWPALMALMGEHALKLLVERTESS